MTRQGEGTDFIGKPLPELSQLPILQVSKAMKGDSGLFSWSMLNDSQQFDGTFEIIVQDQIGMIEFFFKKKFACLVNFTCVALAKTGLVGGPFHPSVCLSICKFWGT